MRKLMLIALLAVWMIASAQSDYTYSLTTSGDAIGTIWDYSDTLTNGETLDAIIRVKSNSVMNMRFQILTDEISGTGTYTATIFGSNDGVTYIATGDSITSPLTADGSIWVLCRNFNYSYCKLLMTSTGTETSRHKVYYSFRKE